jgi:hypothetical protein
MSQINGKRLESTNGFDVFYEGLDRLTTRLDQLIYLTNLMNQIYLIVTNFKFILSNNLKKKIFHEKFGFIFWFHMFCAKKG